MFQSTSSPLLASGSSWLHGSIPRYPFFFSLTEEKARTWAKIHIHITPFSYSPHSPLSPFLSLHFSSFTLFSSNCIPSSITPKSRENGGLTFPGSETFPFSLLTPVTPDDTLVGRRKMILSIFSNFQFDFQLPVSFARMWFNLQISEYNSQNFASLYSNFSCHRWSVNSESSSTRPRMIAWAIR